MGVTGFASGLCALPRGSELTDGGALSIPGVWSCPGKPWDASKAASCADAGAVLAVFAIALSLLVGQILTLRELKDMNAKLTPPAFPPSNDSDIVVFAPPPPTPSNYSLGGVLEYKVVSWNPGLNEGGINTYTNFGLNANGMCLCSGKPVPTFPHVKGLVHSWVY